MYYKYRVEYYDEIENKKAIATGVVFGKDYTEATAAVCSYYDDAAIGSIHLSFTNWEEVYEMTREYKEGK